MPHIPTSFIRAAALATLVSGMAFAVSVNAAATDTPAPHQYASSAHEMKMEHNPKAMAEHVEERIKSLHSKLRITEAQESKWGDVAQIMRDNEAAIAQLIEQRHENPAAMTAMDDLQSYENITQAHLDGLKKLMPAFQTLYNDMSEDQQKSADKVFGRFEGHRDGKASKKSM